MHYATQNLAPERSGPGLFDQCTEYGMRCVGGALGEKNAEQQGKAIPKEKVTATLKTATSVKHAPMAARTTSTASAEADAAQTSTASAALDATLEKRTPTQVHSSIAGHEGNKERSNKNKRNKVIGIT